MVQSDVRAVAGFLERRNTKKAARLRSLKERHLPSPGQVARLFFLLGFSF